MISNALHKARRIPEFLRRAILISQQLRFSMRCSLAGSINRRIDTSIARLMAKGLSALRKVARAMTSFAAVVAKDVASRTHLCTSRAPFCSTCSKRCRVTHPSLHGSCSLLQHSCQKMSRDAPIFARVAPSFVALVPNGDACGAKLCTDCADSCMESAQSAQSVVRS